MGPDTAPQADAGLAQRVHSPEHRGDAALHVCGTTTVEPARDDVLTPRIEWPRVNAAGRNDVEVTVQRYRSPFRFSRQVADQHGMTWEAPRSARPIAPSRSHRLG